MRLPTLCVGEGVIDQCMLIWEEDGAFTWLRSLTGFERCHGNYAYGIYKGASPKGLLLICLITL